MKSETGASEKMSSLNLNGKQQQTDFRECPKAAASVGWDSARPNSSQTSSQKNWKGIAGRPGE